MSTSRLVAGALLGLVLLPGCQYVVAAHYLFGPRQIQKAEFTLTEGRLVLLIEFARAEDENPVFAQNLHDKFGELLAEHELKTTVVPRDSLVRLRQENADFEKWAVQKVGQRLQAEQVLYVRVDRFQLRESSGSPLIAPAAQMRLKLVDAESGKRLWPGPEEREGRTCGRSRPTQEAADPLVIDSESAKLGKDAAWVVAQWFYDVDLEQKTPWEP